MSADDKSNELTEMGGFIEKHAKTSLDRVIGAELWLMGQQHAVSEADCEFGHMGEQYPCFEWERGIHLGIAWLKARIETDSAAQENPESS